MPKIQLDLYETKEFFRKHGIDPYEKCPCGSGKKYKWCCKQNTTPCKSSNDIKRVYHNIKNEIWNRRNWKTMTCHWGKCCNDTQRCHSIQNNRFLSQICGIRKEVYHFIPKGTLGDERIELQEEPISLASTFNGFCNIHDKELFSIIEGSNDILYSIQQMYALVYRNFYYMLLKKEISQSIIFKKSIRSTPRYYQKEYKPRNSQDAQIALEMLLDLRKNQVMHDELLDIVSDIESNYDENRHTWDIINNCMIFSIVRTLKVTNANFCFQTVREYLLKSEVVAQQNTATIDDYQIKRYDHISTIVLPNVLNNEINVFFAISNRHKMGSPQDFIIHVNSCSDEEIIDILNNIIIDAYEELYISKNKMYDMVSPKLKKQVSDILLKQTFYNNVPLLLDDIYKSPKVKVLQLRD
ncbi:SEC-C domain-containing protein [Clostridium autoethanogenum]|uniref:SEC-C domain-containing protein n=1 Tax=Clostridium autoethanogenum TaxID=84023 RepID=A0A3M0SJ20_9CLOT|nr:SEC-C domain-containing protein [Clostridium autoethanogenum]RMC97790.1 SEC-C domain-containing protein [Clostridium autoethanogenum]